MNTETLFEQYSNQTNEYPNYSAHSDGHLDGDVAGTHTDEHADRTYYILIEVNYATLFRTYQFINITH